VHLLAGGKNTDPFRPSSWQNGTFPKVGYWRTTRRFQEDMQRLVTQLQLYKPQQVIVIGDMFHSSDNKEHELFLKWRNDFSQLAIRLVKGNHDVLKSNWYKTAGITIDNCEHTVNNFVFVHDFKECTMPGAGYIFSGHIHPGISISGLGNQSLHFPCFYFGAKYAVLPAFAGLREPIRLNQNGANLFMPCYRLTAQGENWVA
jgi:metallophosphoesterase superfamily enzyme